MWKLRNGASSPSQYVIRGLWNVENILNDFPEYIIVYQRRGFLYTWECSPLLDLHQPKWRMETGRIRSVKLCEGRRRSHIRQFLGNNLFHNLTNFRRGMEALPPTLDATLLLKLQKQVGMRLRGIRSLQLIHMILGYWYLKFSMAVSSLLLIRLAKQRMCRQVCIKVTRGC